MSKSVKNTVCACNRDEQSTEQRIQLNILLFQHEKGISANVCTSKENHFGFYMVYIRN